MSCRAPELLAHCSLPFRGLSWTEPHLRLKPWYSPCCPPGPWKTSTSLSCQVLEVQPTLKHCHSWSGLQSFCNMPCSPNHQQILIPMFICVSQMPVNSRQVFPKLSDKGPGFDPSLENRSYMPQLKIQQAATKKDPACLNEGGRSRVPQLRLSTAKLINLKKPLSHCSACALLQHWDNNSTIQDSSSQGVNFLQAPQSPDTLLTRPVASAHLPKDEAGEKTKLYRADQQLYLHNPSFPCQESRF